MNVATYPELKETGALWLGAIPTHWDVTPLKYLVTLRSGGTPNKDRLDYWVGDIPWASAKDLKSDQIGNTIDHISEIALNETAVTLAPANCILVLVRGMTLAKAFPVVRIERPMAFNQDLKALTPSGRVETSFLAWALKATAQESMDRCEEAGHGTKALRMDAWLSLSLPCPPTPEQIAIAGFLERETGKIDALVDQQRRLIALLKEKRQAVISHAVTKGLNPNAPMKDSGIEWLGEVPAHWEVRAIWLMFELGRGRVLSHQDIADNEGPYPVYSSQTENDGEMGSINTFDFEGDYLTWTTDGANAGTVFSRLGKFNCTNVCGTLKAKSVLNLSYFQSALSLATSFYVRHDINPKLMNNVMASIKVPVPPEAEQAELVAYVGSSTGSFAALESEAEFGIALLQERRAALISAAVTGKIDVRGLVHPNAVAA